MTERAGGSANLQICGTSLMSSILTITKETTIKLPLCSDPNPIKNIATASATYSKFANSFLIKILVSSHRRAISL